MSNTDAVTITEENGSDVKQESSSETAYEIKLELKKPEEPEFINEPTFSHELEFVDVSETANECELINESEITNESDVTNEPQITNGSTDNENRKEDASRTDTSFNRPPYIPPHLMGRDLNNPEQDVVGTGRRIQKPRLGVKVPYRNLTSQIVSQDEIAQEILERSLRKYTYTDVPEGGDIIFAKTLTHRLASKISNSVDNSDKSDKRKENDDVVKSADSKKQDKINLIEKILESDTKDTGSSTSNVIKKFVSSTVDSKEGDKVKENFDMNVEELYSEISSSLTEDCKGTETVKIIPFATLTNSCSKIDAPVTLVNGSAVQISEPGLDEDTLLAILEDASEPTDNNVNTLPKPDSAAVFKRKKRIKALLDPDVEKELALKQLMDFETKKKRMTRKMRTDEAIESNAVIQQNGVVTADKVENVTVTPVKQKTTKPRIVQATLSSPPKRFPKKYHRIIKRQLRSSKLKAKSASPETPKKQLPEVPEVQIAINQYFKTYAKRKYKPDEKVAEKLIEKKQKIENGVIAEAVANSGNVEPPEVSALQDENCNETEEDVVDEKEEALPGPKPKANSKVMREINRLLGDEGAINMIYAIEQKRLLDSKHDANTMPSLRRKSKDLQLKEKLVKNAVLRLSMSSSQASPARLVRRLSPETSIEGGAVTRTKSGLRKTSIESTESNTSERVPPKARKVAAEASRIIRRHSSSSSYSSDDEETSDIGEKSQQVDAFDSNHVAVENAPVKVIEKNNNESKESQICDTEVGKGKSAKSRRSSKEEARSSNKIMEVLSSGSNYIEISEQITLKEITIRKYDNLVQIILISSSTKMKNALNIRILRELVSVLNKLQKDDSCRTVLVTSTGSSFCQGIDLQSLICADKIERLKIVNEFINTLTHFTRCLSQFRKLLIAGVHGSAVGLGVTMLPFFDMVIASDKATFYTPYVKLGQIPEAGATLTLPHLLGNTVTSELLFGCRMLTATEALQFGLVTRTLWPDKFSEELLPLARGIAGHSSQSMESTKMLLRRGMMSKLNDQFEIEANLLREHWCSDECQQRFAQYLEQEAILQNK